jgi:WXXGXW repeat (2 copies)
MKKTLALMMILAGGLLAAPRVTVGIGFGAPAPVAVVPVCPGPGYAWVNGYYAPTGVWMAGYWAPPAVVRVAPHYERGFERGRVADRGFEHFRR